jgi:hypothetical protein
LTAIRWRLIHYVVVGRERVVATAASALHTDQLRRVDNRVYEGNDACAEPA